MLHLPLLEQIMLSRKQRMPFFRHRTACLPYNHVTLPLDISVFQSISLSKDHAAFPICVPFWLERG